MQNDTTANLRTSEGRVSNDSSGLMQTAADSGKGSNAQEKSVSLLDSGAIGRADNAKDAAAAKSIDQDVNAIAQKTGGFKPGEVSAEQAVAVSSLRTMEEVRQALEKAEHPLRYIASRVVFSDYQGAKIMVIGEAPGEEEDKQGLPFVGASGQVLEQALNCVDLYRDKDLYITNIVPFRPPGNRTPVDSEIAFFKPFVYRQVELIDPKIIILVGGTAYKAFFDDKIPVSKARGNFLKWRDWNVLVVFHPSYLLRMPTAKQIMWHDVIALRKWLDKQG